MSSAGLRKDVVFETFSGSDQHRFDEAYRSKYRTRPYLEAIIGKHARSATVEILPGSNVASKGE